jgi:hypothetical protein
VRDRKKVAIIPRERVRTTWIKISSNFSLGKLKP